MNHVCSRNCLLWAIPPCLIHVVPSSPKKGFGTLIPKNDLWAKAFSKMVLDFQGIYMIYMIFMIFMILAYDMTYKKLFKVNVQAKPVPGRELVPYDFGVGEPWCILKYENLNFHTKFVYHILEQLRFSYFTSWRFTNKFQLTTLFATWLRVNRWALPTSWDQSESLRCASDSFWN